MWLIKRFFEKQNIIQIRKFQIKVEDIENKIPHVSGLVLNTDFNSTSREVEKKIPSFDGQSLILF